MPYIHGQYHDERCDEITAVQRADQQPRCTCGIKMLKIQPIDFSEACAFIIKHHKHHLPPQGHKFSIGLNDGEKVVGVITVGRPVARHFDNGLTLEVTRCCTDETKNAASKLYATAWRAARALGYSRLITYTLKEESGTSLIAACWRLVGEAGGGSWNTPSSNRFRVDKSPIGQKNLWEFTDEDATRERIII